MKITKFTDGQIIGLLQHAGAAMSIKELCLSGSSSGSRFSRSDALSSVV
jgi:hypothetical protein